jgi:hypothetical protein
MSTIKLKPIPEKEESVRVALNIKSGLMAELEAYARFYTEAYRTSQAVPPVATLAPHMLASFLAADKAFQKWLQASRSGKNLPQKAEQLAD